MNTRHVKAVAVEGREDAAIAQADEGVIASTSSRRRPGVVQRPA